MNKEQKEQMIKKLKEETKKKSYCDIPDKDYDSYISNPKSLSKIRNKCLRQFCTYYYAVKVASKFADVKNMVKTGKEHEIDNHARTMECAYGIFRELAKKDKSKNPEIKDLLTKNPEMEERIRWISKRAVYDYLATLKYIEVCNAIFEGMLDDKKTTIIAAHSSIEQEKSQSDKSEVD